MSFLSTALQETDAVTLTWQKPSKGGSVIDYRIHCRTANNDWRLVELTYATEIILDRQPSGDPLEYRVLASNKTGLSEPSNTVSVVL